MQETWAGSLGQEDPRSRSWHPITVFWPGKFHGQRSLADCSPWGLKETRLSAGHGEEFAFFFWSEMGATGEFRAGGEGDVIWCIFEKDQSRCLWEVRVWRARVEASRLLRRLLPSSRAQGDVGLTQGGG